MFFDARKAKQLAPGEHLLVDGCQGLRLVATESTRTWVYRYKVGDKMKLEVIRGAVTQVLEKGELPADVDQDPGAANR